MPISVLVVDDDVDTLDVFCTMLELHDHDVVGKGKDGKEAFELYKKIKPDVVLLDIMMPNYNGFYAIEKIMEFDSKAKIVVVTGDLTEDTAKKLQELGVAEMLYKPYEIDDVSKVVNCAVQGKKIYSVDLIE
jgi:DNA-binding NarL/FixJ family response regulator